ncbi:MAG: hypothetical protein JOZ12_04600 [Sinobacteraceae bacterium]|nr:hypothetical protein [Nevskiaceae bacterium]
MLKTQVREHPAAIGRRGGPGYRGSNDVSGAANTRVALRLATRTVPARYRS